MNVAADLVTTTGESVALVDLNLQCGDMEVLLGLDSPGTIIDIARAYPNVDATFIGSLMAEAANGIRVLAGPRSPERCGSGRTRRKNPCNHCAVDRGLPAKG